AASEPTQIESMCAPVPAGADTPMRYVTDLSPCKPGEKRVSVYPGPLHLCVSTGIVTLGSASDPCQAGTQKLKVPGGPPSFYCAEKSNGQLRMLGNHACASDEVSLAIGP